MFSNIEIKFYKVLVFFFNIIRSLSFIVKGLILDTTIIQFMSKLFFYLEFLQFKVSVIQFFHL
jgi:hypothetical protein